MSDALGKNVPLDKVERAVLLNLIAAAWKGKFVDSEACSDALKSIRMKVGFSEGEMKALKAAAPSPSMPAPAPAKAPLKRVK